MQEWEERGIKMKNSCWKNNRLIGRNPYKNSVDLRKLRESCSTGKTGMSTEQILDEIRADRN